MADLTQALSQFLYSRLALIGGSGGSASGVLNVSTTSYTTAGTSEEDAWTYTLPANTLSADGRTLRISVFAASAATANNKTVKVYFGSTSITINGSTAAPNGQSITGQILVYRTGATAQLIVLQQASVGSGNQVVGSAIGSADLTAATTIKVTLTTPTAAGDATFKSAMVELLN